MKRILLLFIIIFTACEKEMTVNEDKIAEAIVSVMDAQEAAWNEGDIEGYMEGYWKSDSLRFASGGNVSYGWEKTLANYKRGYPDRSIMGRLTFSDVEISILSSSAAIAFGKWALKREMDNPHGLYTLLFRKTNQGWRIVADHTSSATN